MTLSNKKRILIGVLLAILALAVGFFYFSGTQPTSETAGNNETANNKTDTVEERCANSSGDAQFEACTKLARTTLDADRCAPLDTQTEPEQAIASLPVIRCLQAVQEEVSKLDARCADKQDPEHVDACIALGRRRGIAACNDLSNENEKTHCNFSLAKTDKERFTACYISGKITSIGSVYYQEYALSNHEDCAGYMTGPVLREIERINDIIAIGQITTSVGNSSIYPYHEQRPFNEFISDGYTKLGLGRSIFPIASVSAKEIITAPTPADGECSDTENEYTYVAYEAQWENVPGGQKLSDMNKKVCTTPSRCNAYEVSFCLGGATPLYEGGKYVLTSTGGNIVLLSNAKIKKIVE